MTTRSHSAGRVHTVLETHAQHALAAQDATNQRIEAILRTFQGQVASLQVEVGQLKTSLATQESQHQREVAVLNVQIRALESQLTVKTESLQTGVAKAQGQIEQLRHGLQTHYHQAYQYGPTLQQTSSAQGI